MEKLVADCATGEVERIDLTPEEHVEFLARAASDDPAVEEAERDEVARQGAALQELRMKAREVAAGQGTFTPGQVQRILAAIVLRTTRP